MSTLAKEFAYAARTLAKSRAFTIIAVLTVALGIGASSAIFSVVSAVLLRPLPYADADRLVLIWTDLRNRDMLDFLSAPGDMQDLRDGSTAFEEIAAISEFRAALTGDEGDPEQVDVAGATTNLLRTLGTQVALGRGFMESDGYLPTPPAEGEPAEMTTTTLLAYDFWQRRYGGDPGVLGRIIDVNGNRWEIVGVLAPEFELLFPPNANVERVPDLVGALRLDYVNSSRINVFLRMIGRLRPGVTLARAQAEADAVSADLQQRFPTHASAGAHMRVEPMHDDLVADVRPVILALMGGVLFVLLIACANVANLVLVRASARERELAVRAAIGGSRWVLVRQMLVESLALAVAGALLGLLLASLGTRLLLMLRPENMPRLDAITIDPGVLAFATLATMLAALLFGIVPALRASRVNVADALRKTGRTPGLGGVRRLSSGVVVAEVALTFVLLIGSGLMLRSFIALQRSDPGYDPEGVLTFAVNPSFERWNGERRAVFVRELRERLGALPGVVAVTAARPLPLDGTPITGARWGREDALEDPGKFQQGDLRYVQPGYFEAMGTRVIAGREFTEVDDHPEVMHVVIDELFAAKAFPGENAVGQRFMARIRSDEPEWFEVIGVVEHQRHITPGLDSRETMYFAEGVRAPAVANRWVIRTSGDPTSLGAAVRAVVAEIDPLLPVADLQPMSALVDRANAPTRFALVLIAIFAGIAAALAAVGLYGVLATAVRQRTSEIGVRMAFGAPRARILQLTLGHGLRLSAAGIAIGVLAALMLTRVIHSMLIGVQPTDPVTFAAMAAVFMVIAAVACWVPAWRAATVDPTTALREE